MSVKRKWPKPAKNIQPLLWGKSEVMAAIGVRLSKLEQMLRDKELPPRVVISGNKKGWRPEDIKTWLAQRLEKREVRRGKA